MKEFTFIWSIENISYAWHKTKEPIVSPSFIAASMQNTSWNLELNTRGIVETDYLSLELKRGYDGGPFSLSVNFEISCISSEKSILHSHFFPEADKSFEMNDSFCHPRFLKRHHVFGHRKSLYLPRDTLTLSCRMWKDDGDVNKSGESFGITRLDIERISSVENLKPDIKKENNVSIYSQLLNKEVISIRITHYGDAIGVLITPINTQSIKFSILKLTFVEKTNRTILCEHLSSWLDEHVTEIWRLPVLCKSLAIGNEKLLENDVEMLSEFVYPTGKVTQTLENFSTYSSRLSDFVSNYIVSCIPSGNLTDCPGIPQDLWNSYVEDNFCDVELKTQTKSFFVHKFVLCARSSVFLAMLSDDMKEKRNGCIEIEDITDDILEKFLFFLYTDTFNDIEWNAAIGLYYVADKYQVERLKVLCCSYFLESSDVDNICELLVLSNRHHDSDFKTRLEDFILENEEEIFSSSTWKQFIYQEPLISAETMFLRYDKEREEDDSTETYEDKLSRLPRVMDDFRSVYDGKTINDIILKTTGATFPAHKSVLCASSIKLRERFTKAMWDKSSNIIEIQDLEDDIFSRMLRFLYTDSLENMEWDNAIKLYHAANTYEIHRLKIKCTCFLLENLKTSNASDLVLLAHERSDVKLKSVVEDFILLHDEEIFGSDEWAQFSKNNLLLANETMRLKYTRKCDKS